MDSQHDLNLTPTNKVPKRKLFSSAKKYQDGPVDYAKMRSQYKPQRQVNSVRQSASTKYESPAKDHQSDQSSDLYYGVRDKQSIHDQIEKSTEKNGEKASPIDVPMDSLAYSESQSLLHQKKRQARPGQIDRQNRATPVKPQKQKEERVVEIAVVEEEYYAKSAMPISDKGGHEVKFSAPSELLNDSMPKLEEKEHVDVYLNPNQLLSNDSKTDIFVDESSIQLEQQCEEVIKASKDAREMTQDSINEDLRDSVRTRGDTVRETMMTNLPKLTMVNQPDLSASNKIQGLVDQLKHAEKLLSNSIRDQNQLLRAVTELEAQTQLTKEYQKKCQDLESQNQNLADENLDLKKEMNYLRSSVASSLKADSIVEKEESFQEGQYETEEVDKAATKSQDSEKRQSLTELLSNMKRLKDYIDDE